MTKSNLIYRFFSIIFIYRYILFLPYGLKDKNALDIPAGCPFILLPEFLHAVAVELLCKLIIKRGDVLFLRLFYIHLEDDLFPGNSLVGMVSFKVQFYFKLLALLLSKYRCAEFFRNCLSALNEWIFF